MVEMMKVKNLKTNVKYYRLEGQIKYRTWDKICKLFYSKREAREMK